MRLHPSYVIPHRRAARRKTQRKASRTWDNELKTLERQNQELQELHAELSAQLVFWETALSILLTCDHQFPILQYLSALGPIPAQCPKSAHAA